MGRILLLHLIGKLMSRKRSATRQSVRPTSRDTAIFAYLAQLGLASDGQIRAQFWPEAKLQTCVDRLEKLARAGYLQREYTSARGRTERVYWTRRKALQALLEVEREPLSRAIWSRPPAAAEIAHLLRTRDVLDLFSRAGMLISFTSEHALKREVATGGRASIGAQGGAPKGQVADGRLALALPHASRGEQSAEGGAEPREEGIQEGIQEVLLEIDGAYYGKRLRAKITALASSPLPVLWVTGTKARRAHLQALAAPYPRIYPVRFADLVHDYAP